MNIAVVGIGYVGLVSAACFAEMGANVYCVDIDEGKINLLKNKVVPIYEEGLNELIENNISDNRLHFTTSLSSCINDVDIVFIAVGTPQNSDGGADLEYVFSVARDFGANLSKYTLLVTKSTVPVGTSYKIREIVQNELNKRGVKIDFDVASNPEFLKEGSAKKDFMMPDRVVIGTDSNMAKELMSSLYRPFLLNNYRVIFMDILSAEMTKYAANAMLATRISFMNEIATLCELTGADVNFVRSGIASDLRIGGKFLYPGCGYGGSCFPKDVKALINTAANFGYKMKIISAVEEVNNNQKMILFEKLNSIFNGEFNNKTIAVWGLSFKPGTDDIREAPSIVLIKSLINAGANIRVYDPIAMKNVMSVFNDSITYSSDIYDAADGADAVALVTEWKQFRILDLKRLKSIMRDPIIVDGRNIYDKNEMEREGVKYYYIGHK
jgi:UDPglucose 6-dehydrogenase